MLNLRLPPALAASVVLSGLLCAASVFLASPALAQDTDGDGVPDRYDRCLLTPPGAPVDPAGCAAECNAQRIGADAFGRTLLTEIGINQQGAFGTTSAAPTIYHARPSSGASGGRLGFVADPDRSAWTNFRGDYFLPGSPEEGWGLSFGEGASRNNNTAGAQEIPGEVVEAVCVPSGLCGPRGGARIVWRGTDASGLVVEQEAIVLHEGVFILLNISMTNTTSAPMADVYYIRNVDPDNNTPVNGDHTTRNTVESQFPPLGTGSQALVSATQGPDLSPTMVDEAYLALVSRSPSAVVSWGGFSNRSARIAHAGEVPHTIMEGATRDADEAISVAFRFDIPAGETVRFTYLYVLGVSAVDDALLCAAEDSDFDGVPDAIDVDDDNDGIPDLLEATAFATDPGGDIDGDGVPNWRDPQHVPGGCPDVVAPLGVCDSLPVGIDADRDGIPNHLDLDSDGDGLTDTRESGGVDTTGQGRPDECASVGEDGGCRRADGSSLLVSSLIDTDGVAPPDMFDLDSDGDGIPDAVEAFDTDGDAVANTVRSGNDHDDDGIDDAFDPDCVGMPTGCRAEGDPVLAPLAAHRDANGDGVGDWLVTCGDGYVTAGEVCDTGGPTETCSSTCRLSGMQPCVDDGECDSAICNGTTRTCESCTDTTADGVDLGCTDARPVCVAIGAGAGCEVCDDTASGAGVDEGCRADAPECDVVGRTCRPCTDPVACPSMPDGGMPDGGMADGGTADGGTADGGRLDGGVPDGSTIDAGPPTGQVRGSGVSCAASSGTGRSTPALALAALALAFALRRKRR